LEGERFTATGFPRVFFLRYHGYAKYFPLWAMARFRSLKKGNRHPVLCGVPKGRVGDYAESHSGLPPQTVFSGSERTWARFSPQIMRGIMRAVGAIMRSPNMDRRF
jgi:hypothetical protein